VQTPTRSRPFAWGIIIFLGLAVLLPTQDLPAEETCPAVDMYDQPRPCTFLEEHGACLWYSLDSFDACIEGSGGFWDSAACHVGVQVDLLACNLGLPMRLLKSIVDL